MMEMKILPLNFIPDNCALLAPDEFSALLAGYSEALDKPDSAVALIEREVLLDLIHKWLDNPENRKKLCLIKNIGT